MTGEGLLVGVVLRQPKAAEVATAALSKGFIVNAATPDRLRLAPPYVLTQDDADAFLHAWPTILDEVF